MSASFLKNDNDKYSSLLRSLWEFGQCCGSSLPCRHNERDGLATRLGSYRKWLTGGSQGLFVVAVEFVAVVVVGEVVVD